MKSVRNFFSTMALVISFALMVLNDSPNELRKVVLFALAMACAVSWIVDSKLLQKVIDYFMNED